MWSAKFISTLLIAFCWICMCVVESKEWPFTRFNKKPDYYKYDITCSGSDPLRSCVESCTDLERIKCNSTNVCIKPEWICNGNNDCGDFSDETHCHGEPKCESDQFKCRNGLCIPKSLVCDGSFDCYDNSDETNCTEVSHKKHVVADHRCGRDNGGCSHFCLPSTTKGSWTCGCPLGFHLYSDRRTCEDTGKFLIYMDVKTFHLKNMNTDKSSIDLVALPFPSNNSVKYGVAMDFDHKTESVFWADIGLRSINRMHLNGSNPTAILQSSQIRPEGVAYDWINDKIYWVNRVTKTIEVINSDGSMRTCLVWEDIGAPEHIVVNPEAGIMYWIDQGIATRIDRANMDGSRHERFVSVDISRPTGLAIDYESDRLYWTDASKKTIEYVNLDGTGRTLLKNQDAGIFFPFGLEVYQDKVYWIEQGLDCFVRSANKNEPGNGYDIVVTVRSDKFFLMDVHVYHERRKGVNRCGENNGGCSHMCLLNAEGYSCACPVGIKLGKDGKTCEQGPKQYLLFAYNSNIHMMSLDVEYSIDVALPMPPLKEPRSVVIDTATGHIYWSEIGEKKIRRANRDGSDLATVIEGDLHDVYHIAIDTLRRKIYWNNFKDNQHIIEVADLDGQNRQVFISTDLGNVTALTLHDKDGYIFWAQTKNISETESSIKIERADVGGKNRRILYVSSTIINDLAVDGAESRLYWTDMDKITSSDFIGENRRSVDTEDIFYPVGVAIAGQYIYCSELPHPVLYKVDKTTYKTKTLHELQGPKDKNITLTAVF